MGKAKYNTSLRSIERREHSKGEDCYKPILVEPGESLPIAVMIEMQMDAGVRKQVAAQIKRMFHFGADDNVPDQFIDPKQDFNFNMEALDTYKAYLEAKIRGQVEQAKAALDAAQKIKDIKDAKSKSESNGSGNVQEVPEVHDSTNGTA